MEVDERSMKSFDTVDRQWGVSDGHTECWMMATEGEAGRVLDVQKVLV